MPLKGRAQKGARARTFRKNAQKAARKTCTPVLRRPLSAKWDSDESKIEVAKACTTEISNIARDLAVHEGKGKWVASKNFHLVDEASHTYSAQEIFAFAMAHYEMYEPQLRKFAEMGVDVRTFDVEFYWKKTPTRKPSSQIKPLFKFSFVHQPGAARTYISRVDGHEYRNVSDKAKEWKAIDALPEIPSWKELMEEARERIAAGAAPVAAVAPEGFAPALAAAAGATAATAVQRQLVGPGGGRLPVNAPRARNTRSSVAAALVAAAAGLPPPQPPLALASEPSPSLLAADVPLMVVTPEQRREPALALLSADGPPGSPQHAPPAKANAAVAVTVAAAKPPPVSPFKHSHRSPIHQTPTAQQLPRAAVPRSSNKNSAAGAPAGATAPGAQEKRKRGVTTATPASLGSPRQFNILKQKKKARMALEESFQRSASTPAAAVALAAVPATVVVAAAVQPPPQPPPPQGADEDVWASAWPHMPMLLRSVDDMTDTSADWSADMAMLIDMGFCLIQAEKRSRTVWQNVKHIRWMGVGPSAEAQAKAEADAKAKARWEKEVNEEDAPIKIVSNSLEWFQEKFPPGCLHSLTDATKARDDGTRGAGTPATSGATADEPSPSHGANRVWNVYRQGSFGENVLHLVLLRRGKTPEGKAIARYLVETFGTRLVNVPLQNRRLRGDAPGAYEGETCLHIALVVDELDLVKLLCDAGADIHARCWGPFFKMTGNTFFGEYPLHFAASLSRFGAAAYLARQGALVSSRDLHGNTALHMAVYHNLPEMYDHLLNHCAPPHVESLSDWQDEVQKLKNGMGLTTLTLAASLGLKDMFVQVIKRTRKTKWNYGPVHCYSIRTDEIDSDPHVDRITALQCIVQHGQKDLLSVATVNKIVLEKWDSLQFYMFSLWVLVYLITMAFYMILIQYYRHGPFKTFDKKERVLHPKFAYPGGTHADACEIMDMASSAGEPFRCAKPDTERLLYGDLRFTKPTCWREGTLLAMMGVLLLLSLYDLHMVRKANKRLRRLQTDAAREHMNPPPDVYDVPWVSPGAAVKAAGGAASPRLGGSTFSWRLSFGSDKSRSRNSVTPVSPASPTAIRPEVAGARGENGHAQQHVSGGGSDAAAGSVKFTRFPSGPSDDGAAAEEDGALGSPGGEGKPSAYSLLAPVSKRPQLMRLSTLAVLKSRVHGFLQHRANNKRWRDKQLQDDLRDLHKRILFIKALKEGKRLNLADISLPLADKLEELLKNVIAIPSGSDLFLYTFQIVYCTHLVNWVTGKSWDGVELSIGALLGWLYSLTFARGMRQIGHLVEIFFRMLKTDLVNWAALYLIVLVAFSCAIFCVIKTEYPDSDTNIIPGDFGSISSTLFTQFRFTFGYSSYTPYRELPENQAWANFLFIAYSICTQVVLANTFIAMLNHTFEYLFKRADEEGFLTFTHMVLRLERRCPEWLLRRFSTVSFIEDEKTKQSYRYELVEEVDPPVMETQGDFGHGAGGGGGVPSFGGGSGAPGGQGGGAFKAGIDGGGGLAAGEGIVDWILREIQARGGGEEVLGRIPLSKRDAMYDQHRMTRMSHVVKI